MTDHRFAQIEKESSLSIRVLQLSDSHLYSELHGTLLGLNTEASLEAVINDVNRRDVLADLILLTGDLSQDASAEAYTRLAKHIDAFETPSYWVPGNHDNYECMQQHLPSRFVSSAKQVIIGNWQIILMNSQVPRKVYGNFSDSELTFLKEALTAYPEHYALVVMHHHPIDMGCRWIDNIGIRNRHAFWEIAKESKRIRGVLWGHVHQELDQQIDLVHCLSTPSTCVQFKPGTEDFAADTLGPGYRILDLLPTGAIETEVFRVNDASLQVDHSIKGY